MKQDYVDQTQEKERKNKMVHKSRAKGQESHGNPETKRKAHFFLSADYPGSEAIHVNPLFKS